MKTVPVHFNTWDGVKRTWDIPPSVYPPREDTHFLADVLATELRGVQTRRILEIGTGSGALALTLALEGHQVTAIDIHPEAVAVAQGLADSHGLHGQLDAIEQDVRTLEFDSPYDLIVWNVPYLEPLDPEHHAISWRDEVSLTASVEDHQHLSSNILAGRGLTESGFLLLLLSDGISCTDISRAYANDGWAMRPLARTSSGGEHLVALCLWQPWPSRRTLKLEEVESTNIAALESPDLEPGDRVLARKQTLGKGRRGRTWDSRPGDLTSSWVLPPPGGNVNEPHIIQLRTALAAMDGVLRWLDSPSIAYDKANAWHRILGLKWPNDLMIRDQKYGGILIEGRQQGIESRTVAGIGINVCQAPPPWGSLHELHPSGDSELLVPHLTAALAHWFDKGPAGAPPDDAEVLSAAHRAMSRWGAAHNTPFSLNRDGTMGSHSHG